MGLDGWALRKAATEKVVTFGPQQMLVWSASGPARTSGSHACFIERTADGCKVITEEAQTGLLLVFLRARLCATLLASHQDWLQSLKALAEAR